jgi:predicted nucleic acid-binding protein
VNVGLDTSVVLRLLVGKPAAQTAAAVAFLDELRRRGNQPVVSDLVASEAYFALQFHYGIGKAEALAAMAAMFAGGEVKATGTAGRVLSHPGLATARPGFVDRMIHAAYTGAGDSMATFGKSAAKLPQVTVLR